MIPVKVRASNQKLAVLELVATKHGLIFWDIAVELAMIPLPVEKISTDVSIPIARELAAARYTMAVPIRRTATTIRAQVVTMDLVAILATTAVPILRTATTTEEQVVMMDLVVAMVMATTAVPMITLATTIQTQLVMMEVATGFWDALTLIGVISILMQLAKATPITLALATVMGVVGVTMVAPILRLAITTLGQAVTTEVASISTTLLKTVASR